MSNVIWMIAAGLVASVPEVTTGPQLAQQSKSIEAPIEKVTVFSDRAQIVRSSETVKLGRGWHGLRFPDLPGATLLPTVRLAADGAQILRVEVTPMLRERITLEAAEELVKALEALTNQRAKIDGEISVLEAQAKVVRGLSPAAVVPEAERDGRSPPAIDPSAWRRSWNYLASWEAQLLERRRVLKKTRVKVEKDTAKTKKQISRINLGALSEKKVQVLAVVQVDAPQTARFELSYFVPGASWKPRYDLRFDPKAQTVRLQTNGLIKQATGEPWDNVAVRLSTAIPGQSIVMPELLTWTLGEANEFIPQPRARAAPPAPRTHLVQPTRDDEVTRKSLWSLLQNRWRRLQGELADSEEISFADDTIDGALAQPDAASLQQKARTPPRVIQRQALSAPAPASVMDVAETEGVTTTGVRSSRRSRPVRVRQTSLDLFDSPTTKVMFSDRTLPAVTAGGFDYIYRAQTKMTVDSDAVVVEAPLSSEQYPVQIFYEAAPGLSETAYAKAEVKNNGTHPILMGPVAIFSNDVFLGDGVLRTTGPGGTLAMPMGADEDLRLSRRVLPKTKTEGVFSKDDVTTYRVLLEVVSYKRKPVQLRLREPLPKSKHEDVQIELVKSSPTISHQDDEGIMTWALELGPKKVKTIELVYRITRPSDFKLRQQ